MIHLDENKGDDKKENIVPLAEKILKTRTIIISEAVDSKLAKTVIPQIILMELDDPEGLITVIINSPGGEISSGFAIFDMLRFVSCPVRTIISGLAASMGSILSLAADEGEALIMPHGKIMIHQPLLMRAMGNVTELEIHAKEIRKTKDLIIDLYCKKTGKTKAKIHSEIDRDNWLTADEALKFGLIDKIVTVRSELPKH